MLIHWLKWKKNSFEWVNISMNFGWDIFICLEGQKGHIDFLMISCKIDHCALYTINKWHELEQRNKESNPLWPSKLVASCLSWFGGSSWSGPTKLRGASASPPQISFIPTRRVGGQIIPTTVLLTPLPDFQTFRWLSCFCEYSCI